PARDRCGAVARSGRARAGRRAAAAAIALLQASHRGRRPGARPVPAAKPARALGRGDRARSPLSEMPERDQAAAEGEHDLVLFALTCLAAVRAGALEPAEVLQIDEAVRGLQLLAERDDVAELDAAETAARTAALWERYGPRDRTFRPEGVAGLLSEQRVLDDALELATATVNYWERGPGR